MWGQEENISVYVDTLRIIPTRVGTSQRLYHVGCGSKDHPHACGDKLFFYFLIGAPTGSSPRVWGQVNILNRRLYSVGIIPTRVGTSSFNSPMQPQVRDHPHACGDKTSVAVATVSFRGSSPRVWGQVDG